ncbi:MAG: RNA polymerase sigma factor [Chromatiales bacterium]
MTVIGDVILARMCANPVSTGNRHLPGLETGLDDAGEVLARWLLAGRQGDQQAFRLFYEATVRKVYGLALSVVRSPQAAEDVVIDVYLRVWRSAQTYDAQRGAPLAWLLTICRNCALTAMRATDLTPASDSYRLPEERGGDASEALAAFEESSIVRAALADLPGVERQVLSLAFFRGLSHGEIANIVRLPLGTVKTHIRRALARLRGRLSK